ncbi:MAG TPA: hypothetical protein DDX99_04505 [Desulfofustis sp.]|nr:hypothetical protein [Desulfofustis sp.]
MTVSAGIKLPLEQCEDWAKRPFFKVPFNHWIPAFAGMTKASNFEVFTSPSNIVNSLMLSLHLQKDLRRYQLPAQKITVTARIPE